MSGFRLNGLINNDPNRLFEILPDDAQTAATQSTDHRAEPMAADGSVDGSAPSNTTANGSDISARVAEGNLQSALIRNDLRDRPIVRQPLVEPEKVVAPPMNYTAPVVPQRVLSAPTRQTSTATVASATAAQTSQSDRSRGLLQMSAEEIRALPPERKRALLEALGIPAKHLRKTNGAKLDKAIMDLVAALRSPGNHKLTLSLDKKYTVKMRVGDNGEILQLEVKRKKGFWGKLGGFFKQALPFIGMALAPFTGGLSLLATSGMNAITAIKNKNWLGAIGAVAGAFTGGVGGMIGRGVSRVAGLVQNGARLAETSIAAFRARSPTGFMSALAGGIQTFAGATGRASGQLVDIGNRMQRWAGYANTGESVIRGLSGRR